MRPLPRPVVLSPIEPSTASGAEPTAMPEPIPLPIREPAPIEEPPAAPVVTPRILTVGVFITGSVGLTPGGRYAIEVDGDTFRVRGPVDIDAERIAVERPLTAMAATAFESRLVVNERARGSRG